MLPANYNFRAKPGKCITVVVKGAKSTYTGFINKLCSFTLFLGFDVSDEKLRVLILVILKEIMLVVLQF